MKIGIVSIYPPPYSKHSKSGGVASYTHNLVNSLRKKDVEIIIFSNKHNGVRLNYKENGIEIKRCWDQGIIYPFQIFFGMLNKKVDMIHIHHEFFLYGSGISTMIFPVLQLLLKLYNKPMIVTMHNIVPISKLDKNFIEGNRLNGKPSILKKGLYLFVRLMVKLSDAIIVHEDKFKDVLKNEYKCNSYVHVIPHGVEERKDIIEKYKAKEILGYEDKKIVLFFGYLAGYKGIETLIDAFDHINNDDIILLIAGGEHPRLKKDQSYKRYIEELKIKAENTNTNIIFTGFVLEKDIGVYFSAADVIVLPYTTNFSSSGPMSLAIAYEKPFIVSENLEHIVENDKLTFKKPEDLAKKIMGLIKDSELKNEALKNIRRLKNERNWQSISNDLKKLYFSLNGHGTKQSEIEEKIEGELECLNLSQKC